MDLPSELRSAARALVRRPGLSASIVVSLALSIWMATSVFSVAYGVLARPLPYSEPQRIVALKNAPVAFRPDGFGISRVVRETSVLAERAMYVPGGSANLVFGDRPERVAALPVSERFFATLGVPAVVGRAITSTDDVAAAVLSYALWQRSFAGDETVIGRTVHLNGRPYTVLGVMPGAFAFPERTDVWVSVPVPGDFYVNAFAPEYIGRLAPGVTLDQAQSTLRAQLAEALRAQGQDVGNPITLRSLHDELSGGVRSLLHLLVGAALLVLILGAVNAAMLLVAHVGRRRGEFGIRQALGASKGTLYRKLVLESVLLATVGTALGLVVAVWTDELLRVLLPATMPRVHELGIDRAAVLFAATIGVLVGAATGLVGGIRAVRFDVAGLHSAEAKASSGVEGRRLLRSLVLAEIAVAFILSTSAGLLTRSLVGASRVDLGFEPEAVTTFRLHLPDASYPSQPSSRRIALVDQLLERLRAIPSVLSVGLVNDLPLASQMGAGNRLVPADGRANPDTVAVSARVASGDYFRAMGVPVLEGRSFTDADRPGSVPAFVVSQSVARQLAPSGSAVGMSVELFRERGEVVGVVPDMYHYGPDRGPTPELFRAYPQFAIGSISLAVRSQGDVAGPIRDAVRELDPALPLFELRSMRDIVNGALAERRFALTLVSLFSLFGVGLALFGVYAVASVMVVERTREIGIRVALGSSRQGVLRLVLREGVLMGAGGIALGALGAVLLTPALASLLFGVAPHDLATLIGVASLMVGVTLLGGAVPALRASRVDPMIALRTD